MKNHKTKHWGYYIFCALFVSVMVYFLFLTDIRNLVKDVARQAWIFIAMLAIKFGEENWWKPMIIGQASLGLRPESLDAEELDNSRSASDDSTSESADIGEGD